MPTEFDHGLLLGILIGEGHFGGDGRQPQITLRMHERHLALFRWLEQTYPGGRLYGPYDHGGRRYYQWMVRGAYLRDVVVPLLDACLTPTLDGYAYERFRKMCAQYARQLRHTDGDVRHDPGPATVPDGVADQPGHLTPAIAPDASAGTQARFPTKQQVHHTTTEERADARSTRATQAFTALRRASAPYGAGTDESGRRTP